MSTVLIVDDSETVRIQLKRVFIENDFDVLEAENGRVGLDVLKNNASKIDVILCDVNMPEMDGLEMVRLVSEIEELSKIPIFMLTTEASKVSKEIGKDAGVKAWITKPFKPDKVLNAINKYMQKTSLK